MVIKNKKDLIYISWEKLFWKFWVKRVSIDMIVKDAWIAKGTFYLYYKNKEDLYENIVENLLKKWRKFMFYLVENHINIKERFYCHMIWSLNFFQKNSIIRKLIEWDKNYYIWNIDQEYLIKTHISFLKILMGDEFTDIEFISFSSNVKGFFINILNNKNCFQSDKEFDYFVVNLAAVIVNWLFSDYKELVWSKTLKKMNLHCLKK